MSFKDQDIFIKRRRNLLMGGGVSGPAGDPFYGDVLFLLNGQNAITKDNGPLDRPMVNNVPPLFLNSDQTLFGFPTYTNMPDAAGWLNLTGDIYLSQALLNNAFTLEGFLWLDAPDAGDGRIFSVNRFQAAFDVANVFTVACVDIGAGSYTLAGGAVTPGAWFHFAFMRKKLGAVDVLELCVGGLLTDTSTPFGPALNVGNYPGFDRVMGYNSLGSTCRFSNMRFTNNVARYTAPFAPPSAPFPTF